MTHEVTYQIHTKSLLHVAKCACGMDSGGLASKQLAEDWWLAHEGLVQRVRAHLKQSTPSLKGTRDYYLKCAEDTGRSKHDRDLFKQMAHELTVRLGDGDGPGWEQDELPLGLDPR